jgi:MFS family permease
MADRLHDSYAALRLPDYRWFVACLLTQTLASQIQDTVVGWQIYQLTHDPLALGLIGLAEAIPFIGFVLPAGHVADLMDRRRVSLAALVVLLGCAGALFGLTASGTVTRDSIWMLYLFIGLSGVARAFLQPTRTALSADLVPPDLYPNAITWRSSTWQFAAVTGPAAGGLLYGFSGPTLAYAVATGLMLVAFVTLSAVTTPSRGAAREDESAFAGFLDGIRFVRGHRLLLSAFTLDLLAVLFAGAEAILPIFAAEILHTGPEGLGVLRAAPAAGAVLTSVYLSHQPQITRAGRVLLGTVACYGVCMIGFGFSRSFPLSLALLGLSGMFDNVSVVLRQTMLQTFTPRELLGRVAAVNAIFIGSSNELGAFESGVAARLVGAVLAVVLGGTVTLLTVLGLGWGVPELRRLQRIKP